MYRELEVFDKQTDELVACYRLRDLGIRTMQRLWGRPADDPMVDGYEVEAQMMATLRQHLDVDVPFESDKYVYQVGAYRDYPGEEADVASQPQGV